MSKVINFNGPYAALLWWFSLCPVWWCCWSLRKPTKNFHEKPGFGVQRKLVIHQDSLLLPKQGQATLAMTNEGGLMVWKRYLQP